MTTIAEIRDILAAASSPLSTADILEKLGLEDGSREDKKPAYSAIQNGVLAGHFVRHHSSDGLTYSIAPEGQAGYGGRARTGAKPGPKPKADRPARAAARGRKRPADSRPLPKRPAGVIDAAEPPAMQIDPAEVASPPALPKPSDFDLRRRLDAIGSDLADAIADACDAEHPHALIKALVVSREAVSRAQAVLPR